MSGNGIVIRPLGLDDIPALAIMLETAFDVSVAPYLAYSQHGISALLWLQVKYPASFDQKLFYVATVNGYLAGFAEFRLQAQDQGFLCYICVADSCRRQGIAAKLINQFESDHPAIENLDLDVFEHNQGARKAYEKFGFRQIGVNFWHRRRLPTATNDVIMADLMTSTASFQTYGFCRLTVSQGGNAVTIGRIGPTVVRCFSVAVFFDDDLLSGLSATFPSLREALVIVDHRLVQRGCQSNRTSMQNSMMPPIVSHRLRRTISSAWGNQ